MYVHYVLTIYSLYVHYTHHIHIHCMFIICSLYSHYIFTVCSLDIHYMFTIDEFHRWRIRQKCRQNGGLWNFDPLCLPHCWFHESSFKGFSIAFPAPWLAKVESSEKSNGMWFFRHFFAPYLFHRSRNNRLDKQRSKFWHEKLFRKHLKPLRWCSVRGTNNSIQVKCVRTFART